MITGKRKRVKGPISLGGKLILPAELGTYTNQVRNGILKGEIRSRNGNFYFIKKNDGHKISDKQK